MAVSDEFKFSVEKTIELYVAGRMSDQALRATLCGCVSEQEQRYILDEIEKRKKKVNKSDNWAGLALTQF